MKFFALKERFVWTSSYYKLCAPCYIAKVMQERINRDNYIQFNGKRKLTGCFNCGKQYVITRG